MGLWHSHHLEVPGLVCYPRRSRLRIYRHVHRQLLRQDPAYRKGVHAYRWKIGLAGLMPFVVFNLTLMPSLIYLLGASDLRLILEVFGSAALLLVLLSGGMVGYLAVEQQGWQATRISEYLVKRKA